MQCRISITLTQTRFEILAQKDKLPGLRVPEAVMPIRILPYLCVYQVNRISSKSFSYFVWRNKSTSIKSDVRIAWVGVMLCINTDSQLLTTLCVCAYLHTHAPHAWVCIDSCCLYYFVRNSLVALLEALCAQNVYMHAYLNIPMHMYYTCQTGHIRTQAGTPGLSSMER